LRISTLTLFAMLLSSALGVRGQYATPQITGRVTEVGSSAPIAGATVTLLPPITPGNPNFQSVKTDKDGYYRFAPVREGAYSVHVSVDGFVDGDYKTNAAPYGKFLRFDSAAHFNGIDIQLQPEAVIQGAIIGEDGKPIPDVTISAVRQSDAIKNHPVPISSAKSDKIGQFEIKKLPPDIYLVCASGPNGYGDPPYATHWYQERWFENVRSSDGATSIYLKEHEVRSNVRITTSDEKRYRIIVWPSVPEGTTVPDRYDLLIQNRFYAYTRQADGSYVIFDIPPGHYTLVSNAWSQVEGLGHGEQSFDVIDSDVNLRFQLGGPAK
jgi:hypothetical protein